MENNERSKKENVVPHKINDSDDVLLEVVDSEDEILSDSSDIVIVESTKVTNKQCQVTKSLENCNLSTILPKQASIYCIIKLCS